MLTLSRHGVAERLPFLSCLSRFGVRPRPRATPRGSSGTVLSSRLACEAHSFVTEKFPNVRIVSKKRTFSESSADEAYVKSNATKRPCAKEGVRGLFNLGQTCYLNVILQTLLHDPLLNTYFLGNGHRTHECTVPDCIGCAVAEAFADFNSPEKSEGFAALNLLLASWKASPVSGVHPRPCRKECEA